MQSEIIYLYSSEAGEKVELETINYIIEDEASKCGSSEKSKQSICFGALAVARLCQTVITKWKL